jgi:GT2 family glycosyltransferase
MKKIAIIVLNWKQPKLTTETISSLLKINHPSFSYQIILVNNGSQDDSFKIFSKKYKKSKFVKIINSQENLGYAGGNNLGIKYALKNNFDFLVIINNDVIVDPDFIEEMLKQSDHFDIIGPKIYFAPGCEFHKDRYQKKDLGKVIWSFGGHMDWKNIYGSNIGVDIVDDGQFNKINHDVDFISGCCFMANRGIFKTIGLFNKKYFMYFEDVDFCQRAKRSNLKLACIPESIIWHINSGSSKSGGDLHDYFITRNRIYFASKYANLRAKFAILRESIKLLFGQSKWKKQAIIDAYRHNLNKGSWQ